MEVRLNPTKEYPMLRLMFPSLALALLTGVASAQADESRCRSVQSAYYALANDYGTATGFDSDVVVIRRSDGRVIVSQTIGWLRRNLPLYVFGVTPHSGGQYSIRIAYWFISISYPALRGGSVEIWRGASLIDRDAIL